MALAVLEASSPYILLISQWTQGASLSCQFLCSLWASLEHPLVICLMISVLTPHNLDNNLSDVLSIPNLISSSSSSSSSSYYYYY